MTQCLELAVGVVVISRHVVTSIRHRASPHEQTFPVELRLPPEKHCQHSVLFIISSIISLTFHKTQIRRYGLLANAYT